MKPTLLLDLDDTLLVNDIKTFLPHYLGAFSKTVSPYIDPERFVELLMAGTRAMVANRRPDCTLEEVFFDTFFPPLGMAPEEFDPIAERFYAEVFPTLRGLTQPRPEAIDLVEQALAKGYRIVIATNPLFPLTAINQRLEWAGLPVDKYPFELVTSFESFHFVKPEPAYFAEALARIGWPQGRVVTVGNDLKRDIQASRRLGLQAFWVTENGSIAPDLPDGPSASGKLAEVWPWLEQMPVDGIKPDLESPAAMLAVLRSTPAVLDSLCRELPAALGAWRPQPDEWSIKEILCHFRDVDREVNFLRIKKVLDESNPFLPGENTDLWAEERNYQTQNGLQALHQFTQIRMKLLDLLERIGPEEWQRPSRHAIFGPTQLSELVSIAAAHDRLHVRHVHKVLAALDAAGST